MAYQPRFSLQTEILNGIISRKPDSCGLLFGLFGLISLQSGIPPSLTPRQRLDLGEARVASQTSGPVGALSVLSPNIKEKLTLTLVQC